MLNKVDVLNFSKTWTFIYYPVILGFIVDKKVTIFI